MAEKYAYVDTVVVLQYRIQSGDGIYTSSDQYLAVH